MQPCLTLETSCWQARILAFCGRVLIIQLTQCYLHRQLVWAASFVARYSEMNYSNGKFQFQLRLNGSLVLQTRANSRDYSYADYWPEEPIGGGFKVLFNQSGSITFTAMNGSIVKNISSIPGSMQGFNQRAIMEYDGVLSHYVYPKSS